MVSDTKTGDAQATDPEFSVVMPCLNEAETLERCIAKALSAFKRLGIAGEVVIADNGSTDGSQAIAGRCGARVVAVPEKGYGCALRGGIHAARGRYVIMGDSDDSYDFSAIDPFVAKLREGCDLVMGNRFQGGIRPGAMPLKHRWLGNPVLTFIGRLLFRSPVGDFHCGLRGFSKDAFAKMGLQTSGMEFASEMVIKSTLLGFRIAEVPTVLHPDGRSRPPHLRSWRDGWRHLRFMLLFSPLWLFLIPGAALFLLGAAAVLALLNGPRRIGAVELDVHTMLVSAIGCLLGSQTIVFAVFTKTFAVVEGFHPPYPPLEKLQRSVTLEAGLLLGIALFIGGLGVLSSSVLDWGSTSFGHLDPVRTMRRVIPAVLLLGLGAQTVFASFFLGVLGLRRTTRR